MQAQEFYRRLWENYVTIAPSAGKIHELVEARFGPIRNDHVAFRTFDISPISLADLEKPFLHWGYRRDQAYPFPDKHLHAYGYIPPNDDLPLVFLSELTTRELSARSRDWIERTVSGTRLEPDPVALLLGGRPWALPTWAEYQLLEAESAYAAWLSVWGFCANHFTIAVHALRDDPALSDVVGELRARGFVMNEVGGMIKGSPSQLLQQASTVAESRSVTFDAGPKELPSCYYEFAKRYTEPKGELYLGFVAASAKDIFESTTARSRTPTRNR